MLNSSRPRGSTVGFGGGMLMSRMWILAVCATLALGVCSAQAAFQVVDGFDEPLGDSG